MVTVAEAEAGLAAAMAVASVIVDTEARLAVEVAVDTKLGDLEAKQGALSAFEKVAAPKSAAGL